MGSYIPALDTDASNHAGPRRTVIDDIPNTKFIQKCNEIISDLPNQAFVHCFICDGNPSLRLVFPVELVDYIVSYIGTDFRFSPIQILQFIASGSPYMAGVREKEQLLIRELHDHDQCAHIVEHSRVTQDTHSDSLNEEGVLTVSTQHVFHGRHCWRISLSNPNRGEIFYGVTHPSLLEKANLINKCTGASHRREMKHGFANKRAALSSLLSTKCCIDMLLDADRKTLAICKVADARENGNGIVIHQLPSLLPDNVHCMSYAPFIYHSQAKGAAFRIAKIPSSSYGKALPIWIGSRK